MIIHPKEEYFNFRKRFQKRFNFFIFWNIINPYELHCKSKFSESFIDNIFQELVHS